MARVAGDIAGDIVDSAVFALRIVVQKVPAALTAPGQAKVSCSYKIVATTGV